MGRLKWLWGWRPGSVKGVVISRALTGLAAAGAGALLGWLTGRLAGGLAYGLGFASVTLLFAIPLDVARLRRRQLRD